MLKFREISIVTITTRANKEKNYRKLINNEKNAPLTSIHVERNVKRAEREEIIVSLLRCLLRCG